MLCLNNTVTSHRFELLKSHLTHGLYKVQSYKLLFIIRQTTQVYINFIHIKCKCNMYIIQDVIDIVIIGNTLMLFYYREYVVNVILGSSQPCGR